MASDLKMGMRWIKYMLLVVNLLFVITSVLLITVGTTIHTIYTDFEHFISGTWFSPAILLTCIGILMFFVAFFGCYGAAKESTCMVNMFGVMLAVIFVLEIAAAITAFSMQGNVSKVLMHKMEAILGTYPDADAEIKDAVDFMQDRLNCCGINSPNDWEGILGPDSPLPESCCASYRTTWDEEDTTVDFGEVTTSDGPFSTTEPVCVPWPRGCYSRLRYIMSQSVMMLATGATAVAVVQLLGVVFAFMLAKAIRRAKTDREARRWQQRMGHIMNLDAPYQQLSKKELGTSPVMYSAGSPSVN